MTTLAPATLDPRDLRHRGHDPTLPLPLPAQAKPARHRLVQPVLFVLLWTYVFSGAIQTPGGITYVDYLMPGLFILAIAFARPTPASAWPTTWPAA